MILYLPYVKAFTAFLEEKLNYTSGRALTSRVQSYIK